MSKILEEFSESTAPTGIRSWVGQPSERPRDIGKENEGAPRRRPFYRD